VGTFWARPSWKNEEDWETKIVKPCIAKETTLGSMAHVYTFPAIDMDIKNGKGNGLKFTFAV